MKNEIRANYDEVYLFPPRVEDWLGDGHPARFIRQLVESLDLDALGFQSRKAEVGAPSYSNDLLLKVWLYGLMTDVPSTRKLELACLDSIAMVYLTGNHAPDHNTLWRFLNKNRDALKKLFRETVQIAMRTGLVGMVFHAVDGTKIRALPSKCGGYSRKELEKLSRELDELVERAIGEVEANEAEETGEVRLPEELRDPAALKRSIEEALREMDDAGVNYIHPDDPDAKMMKDGDRKEFCYNAQAVVDSESGMIVAEDVVSKGNDNHLLNDMLDEVEENLGDVAEETAADSGYYSGEELSRAEERDRSVLVNMEKVSGGDGEGEFHASRFSYDEERDCVVCPLGEELGCIGTQKDRRGNEIRIFRCRKQDCPSKEKCTSCKKGRLIKIGRYHQAMARQREKQRDHEMKQLLEMRKCVVEPVFGIIKEILGLRRWTVKGIEKVRAMWSIVCTAFNLRKMYGYWRAGGFSSAGS